LPAAAAGRILAPGKEESLWQPTRQPRPDAHANLSLEELKELTDKRNQMNDTLGNLIDKRNRAEQAIIDKMR
jgi:hypothetical protein